MGRCTIAIGLRGSSWGPLLPLFPPTRLCRPFSLEHRDLLRGSIRMLKKVTVAAGLIGSQYDI